MMVNFLLDPLMISILKNEGDNKSMNFGSKDNKFLEVTVQSVMSFF